MTNPPRPLLFERKLLPKVWGGRRLERVLGVDLPPAAAIGESWELYDRPDGASCVRGSELTLAELMRADAAAVLGRGVQPANGGRFPLLLKFLDANEALSVQVHPDDVMARAEQDDGKDEAWVVLQVGARARISKGVRPGVQAAEFCRSAASAAVEPLLWSFRPEVGDCIDVPAGTVHAIGPDVVVFEVQRNSDISYRLYDWGRDREVHVDKGLAALRWQAAAAAGNGRPVATPAPLPDGGELLVANRHFRVRRYRVSHTLRLPTHARFATLTVIGGRGALRWPAAEAPLPLRLGDTALVPAAIDEVTLEAAEPLLVLVCDPGMD